jgi:ribosomal protein L34E
MKTVCEKCDTIIDTQGVLKGQKAFYFEIQVDSEPYINTAVPRTYSGYLCHTCSRKIADYFNILR